MLENEIVIFGASTRGEMLLDLFKSNYNIKYFCDNDESKWGKEINGIKIYAPKALEQDKDVRVVIASELSEEIQMQLREMGIGNFYIYNSLQNEAKSELFLKDKEIEMSLQEIVLGDFLLQTDETYHLQDVGFLLQGSLVLDYVFLQGLAKKFEVETYLEIGSFMGESIAAVAEISDNCYSVSLPDETLRNAFKKLYKKDNFSRYFSRKNKKIVHHEADSKIFDFHSIPGPFQLVFIDGDHTYDGVVSDTKKIFEIINPDDTIVVWHDFKYYSRKYRDSIVKAVFDTLPITYHHQIFAVDTNVCGIYIPEKYLNYFNTKNNSSHVFSYEVTLKPKCNQK
jgi:predicted O-methyltransferase YrrM